MSTDRPNYWWSATKNGFLELQERVEGPNRLIIESEDLRELKKVIERILELSDSPQARPTSSARHQQQNIATSSAAADRQSDEHTSSGSEEEVQIQPAKRRRRGADRELMDAGKAALPVSSMSSLQLLHQLARSGTSSGSSRSSQPAPSSATRKGSQAEGSHATATTSAAAQPAAGTSRSAATVAAREMRAFPPPSPKRLRSAASASHACPTAQAPGAESDSDSANGAQYTAKEDAWILREHAACRAAGRSWKLRCAELAAETNGRRSAAAIKLRHWKLQKKRGGAAGSATVDSGPSFSTRKSAGVHSASGLSSAASGLGKRAHVEEAASAPASSREAHEPSLSRGSSSRVGSRYSAADDELILKEYESCLDRGVSWMQRCDELTQQLGGRTAGSINTRLWTLQSRGNAGRQSPGASKKTGAGGASGSVEGAASPLFAHAGGDYEEHPTSNRKVPARAQPTSMPSKRTPNDTPSASAAVRSGRLDDVPESSPLKRSRSSTSPLPVNKNVPADKPVPSGKVYTFYTAEEHEVIRRAYGNGPDEGTSLLCKKIAPRLPERSVSSVYGQLRVLIDAMRTDSKAAPKEAGQASSTPAARMEAAGVSAPASQAVPPRPAASATAPAKRTMPALGNWFLPSTIVTIAAVPAGEGLAVGTKVEGNYQGKGGWYAGRITAAHADASLDIEYEDGDKERHVALSLVRVVTCVAHGPALVGAKVEVNYHGEGGWHRGRIAAVNADGSCDIEYDGDGEKESRVAASMIRVIRSVAAPASAGDGFSGSWGKQRQDARSALVAGTAVPAADAARSAAAPKTTSTMPAPKSARTHGARDVSSIERAYSAAEDAVLLQQYHECIRVRGSWKATWQARREETERLLPNRAVHSFTSRLHFLLSKAGAFDAEEDAWILREYKACAAEGRSWRTWCDELGSDLGDRSAERIRSRLYVVMNAEKVSVRQQPHRYTAEEDAWYLAEYNACAAKDGSWSARCTELESAPGRPSNRSASGIYSRVRLLLSREQNQEEDQVEDREHSGSSAQPAAGNQNIQQKTRPPSLHDDAVPRDMPVKHRPPVGSMHKLLSGGINGIPKHSAKPDGAEAPGQVSAHEPSAQSGSNPRKPMSFNALYRMLAPPPQEVDIEGASLGGMDVEGAVVSSDDMAENDDGSEFGHTGSISSHGEVSYARRDGKVF